MAGNTPPKKDQIDGRILRLLNLEDTFDLDYSTYFTLIKEKLVEVNRGKKIPAEEVMLLQEELKRVRQKAKSGERFRPNKKKVSYGIGSINVSTPKKSVKILPQSTLIPPKQSYKKQDDTDKSTDNTSKENKKDDNVYQSIIKSLDNITKILSDQLKFDKKQEENQRKLDESNQRKSKEERLESSFSKGIKALAEVGEKVFSPLRNLFDEIVGFLTRLFLAKVVKKFIDWFSDPKNKSKVETLGKLVEKFWPTILAGLVFLNPLGRLVAKAGVMLVKGTVKLATVAIPALLKFIRARGLGGAVAGAVVAGGTAMGLSALAKSGEEKSTDTEQPPKEVPKSQDSNLPQETEQPPEEVPKYKRGGKVTFNSGQDIRGAGVDTQLIAARPGEVVINKETVDAVGAEPFLALNQKYGGPNANKPKIARNVQTASGGGLVLPAFSNGGVVGGSTKLTPDAKALSKEREGQTPPKNPVSGGSELSKLDFSAGATKGTAKRGMCTTGVILTGEVNKAKVGAPNVFTSNDPNNPRGLMAQAVKNMGYGSLPGLGKPRAIKSPYGNVTVNSASYNEWADAVIAGKVPSGALVFNTQKGWDYSGGSSGNDSAIAQEGGRKLWSGHWQSEDVKNGKKFGSVYGPSTKEVVVLTHPAGNSSGAGDSSPSSSPTDETSSDNSNKSNTTDKSTGKPAFGLTYDILAAALGIKGSGSGSGTTATTPGAPAATTPGAPAATTPGAPAATTPGAPAATTPGAPATSDVIQGSSADTGSGWTVKGLKDQQGRPAIFSMGGATAFSAMMKDSGGIVKGSDIASSQRSAQKNAAVGGVPNSKHLKGNALDIHGASQKWMRANGKKYGWIINDYPGSHGGHFDYKGPAAGPGASSPSKKEGEEKTSESEQKDNKKQTTGGGSSGKISGTGVGKGVSIAKKLIGDLNIGPAAAAGIVGNLMLESGLQPDNVENGKGFKDGPINNIPPGTQRVGYGWGQWTNDRLERMRKFLKGRGTDDKPATDEDNYAYLMNELTTTEKIKGHWKGWQGKNIPEDDPKKAATWFMMNWERPSKPHEDRRHKYAADIFAQIKGISAGTKSSEEIASGESGSSGGGSTNGSAPPGPSSGDSTSKPEFGLTYDILAKALGIKGSGTTAAPSGGSGTTAAPSGGSGTTAAPSGGSGTTAAPSGGSGTTAAPSGGSGTTAAPSGGSGTTAAPSGGSGTTAAPSSSTPQIKGSEIDKMSIEQLRTMLDPTKPGASNEVVFNAAKQARQKATSQGLPKQEIERQVLIASVKAKQGISSGGTAQIASSKGSTGSGISKGMYFTSGPIKENTGIAAPGGGADRRIISTPSGQTIRAQPGEYMLSAASVFKLGGVDKLNRLLASLDKNSNPAKIESVKKDISQGIKPYQSGQSGNVNVQSLPMFGSGGVGGMVPTSNNGSEIPFHSPISEAGLTERQRIMDTIGATAFA